MPRRVNNRPTLIYWLIDMRPETIAAGWHSGKPFYCGKTVEGVEKRFHKHKSAARRKPHSDHSKRLLECGEYVRVEVMEVVAFGDDWAARERHWLSLLRFSFPGATNVTDGGEGAPGMIHSVETREKIRTSLLGEKHTPERNANRSAALKGRKLSPETIAKRKGRKVSAETRQKMREARERHTSGTRKGSVRTEEERAAMRAGWQKRRIAQAIDRGIPADVVDAIAPRPDGGPILAFESDKRKDWKQKTATEMFAGLVTTD